MYVGIHEAFTIHHYTRTKGLALQPCSTRMCCYQSWWTVYPSAITPLKLCTWCHRRCIVLNENGQILLLNGWGDFIQERRIFYEWSERKMCGPAGQPKNCLRYILMPSWMSARSCEAYSSPLAAHVGWRWLITCFIIFPEIIILRWHMLVCMHTPTRATWNTHAVI